jgi:hypothetical protein
MLAAMTVPNNTARAEGFFMSFSPWTGFRESSLSFLGRLYIALVCRCNDLFSFIRCFRCHFWADATADAADA